MIKYIYIFPNGMTAVFNENDKQIPKLQGRWIDVRGDLLKAIRSCRPMIQCAYPPATQDMKDFALVNEVATMLI